MRHLKLVKSTKRRINKRLSVKLPELTPAERAEMARFEALTKARAAQRAKVRRLANQLLQPHDVRRAA